MFCESCGQWSEEEDDDLTFRQIVEQWGFKRVYQGDNISGLLLWWDPKTHKTYTEQEIIKEFMA